MITADFIIGSVNAITRYNVTPVLKMAISLKPVSSCLRRSAAGRGQHLADETLQHGLRLLVLDQRTGVEVDPVGLELRELRVGRNLHRGHERPERRAASRGEEHQLAARESQRRSGHQVVARSLQEVQSRLRDGLCVGQHVRRRAAPRPSARSRAIFPQGS